MEIRETLRDLLDNITREESDRNIVDQKNEVAARLGCDPEDIRVRLDATATSLARKGVLVDLKIARERFELRLDAEDLGIKASDPGYREFLDEYVRLGRRRLIPVRYLRSLDAVETGARRLLRESSFQTAWGRFVPYQVYGELRRRLEEMSDEYRRLNGRILENYDSIRLSTEMKYREAAREVYRTLHKDAGAGVPEDFTANFVFRVMSKFPGRAEIEESCRFEIDLSFVPVTSTMAEMESRMASKVMAGAEKAVADEIRQTYHRQVQGFISGLAAQLRSMIYEAVSAAGDNVQKHGHLPGPSVMSLRQLVQKVQQLNFMEDREVIRHLGELSEILDRESEDRDAEEIVGVLKKIAEENRQVLLSLGHRPRAGRGAVSVDADPQPAVDGRKRRGMTGDNEGVEYESIAVSGRRRRGDVMTEKMAG
ncbi:MAG: hypothetical protein K6T65_03705 [Peptococcaceae bacterium]|nr:hypothetical protein [Peptococcaceae bacterium]